VRPASAAAALTVALVFTAGCGLSYQAASAHRAAKMEQELKPGDTMAQVREMFGEPDIEDPLDDHTEVWSYAKHTNSNDAVAKLFYTSAKEGDSGTFEDLRFLDGKLVSWSEGEHTMAEKDTSGITTSFSFGKGGSRHGSHNGTTPTTSTTSDEPSDSSSSGASTPFTSTY
jgi:outer membrane protein assembly factor BamE (lipoprotein component of BamABCDE complex)